MPRIAFRFLAIPLVLLFTSSCSSGPSDTTVKVSPPDFRALTEQRFAANAANDRAFYEDLLAPNFLAMLPHRAAMTRAEYLAHEFGARTGPSAAPQATITDFRVATEGETATVSYRVAEPTPVGDQVFEVRTLRLDSYARVAGRWRLLSMAMAEVPSWPEVAKVDPALLAEYAGIYQQAPGLDIVVTSEGGHLWAAMTGQEKSELFAENTTTFFDRTDSPLARSVFERDAAGRVIALVYRSHDQTLRAPRRPS